MFERLKEKLKGPQPAGPPETVRKFDLSDHPISQDGVTVDGDGWRIDADKASTVRLFELDDPGIEQCLVAYKAKIKTSDVDGKAYLEMWCRFPGKGEFFSKGVRNAASGTTDWASYEIPFYLKQGQRPDLIKLNLIVEGSGTVWIKELSFEKTPLK